MFISSNIYSRHFSQTAKFLKVNGCNLFPGKYSRKPRKQSRGLNRIFTGVL